MKHTRRYTQVSAPDGIPTPCLSQLISAYLNSRPLAKAVKSVILEIVPRIISILALAGGRSCTNAPIAGLSYFNSRPRGRAVLAELADYYCATYISILALAGGRSGHMVLETTSKTISILALAGGRSAKMDAMRVAFFHICHKV